MDNFPTTLHHEEKKSVVALAEAVRDDGTLETVVLTMDDAGRTERVRWASAERVRNPYLACNPNLTYLKRWAEGNMNEFVVLGNDRVSIVPGSVRYVEQVTTTTVVRTRALLAEGQA